MLKKLKMKENICLLCQKREADKTGSHIIPNFLIQSSFADDKSKGRGNELVFPVNIMADFRFGREVLPEKIEKSIGRSLTEEDIEKNKKEPIPYIKDHIFCTECEKRLGVIENLYANAISKVKGNNSLEKVDIAKHLSHLFWLSVIWRISVTDFGFRFIPDTCIEEDIRVILDNCLQLDAKEIPDSGKHIDQLSKYCYYLVKFEEDNQKRGSYIPPVIEQIGNFSPFIINNYVFIFSPLADKDNMPIPPYLELEKYLNGDYLNKCKEQEQCRCLNTTVFEKTLRNNAFLHAQRMKFEIQVVISNYWKEKCPISFAEEVFNLYVKDIILSHKSDQDTSLLMKTLTQENLAVAYSTIFEKWKKAQKLPPSIEHLHD